jgi:hypothetical protein
VKPLRPTRPKLLLKYNRRRSGHPSCTPPAGCQPNANIPRWAIGIRARGAYIYALLVRVKLISRRPMCFAFRRMQSNPQAFARKLVHLQYSSGRKLDWHSITLAMAAVLQSDGSVEISRTVPKCSVLECQRRRNQNDSVTLLSCGPRASDGRRVLLFDLTPRLSLRQTRATSVGASRERRPCNPDCLAQHASCQRFFLGSALSCARRSSLRH